jgi:hypothetical protein
MSFDYVVKGRDRFNSRGFANVNIWMTRLGSSVHHKWFLGVLNAEVASLDAYEWGSGSVGNFHSRQFFAMESDVPRRV